MEMIRFENVSFVYPNGFCAVKDLSFSVQQGENIAVVGQNGAGKSTAAKLVNGLLKPTDGKVTVAGKDTRRYSAAQLARHVGYIFQNPDDQIFHSTVEAELRFGPKVLGFDREKISRMVQYAAQLCGIEDCLHMNPYDLPLSVRKFVTIASVIAMDPEVLILDEPTAGQDLRGMQKLAHLLSVLQQAGKTLLTVTHHMEFTAEHFDRVMVMANQHLLRSGSPEEIFRDGALLEEGMLKRPFICELACALGIQETVVSEDRLIQCLNKMLC